MNRIHFYGNITRKWYTVEITKIERITLVNNTNGNAVMYIAYMKLDNNYDYHSILLKPDTWIEYGGIRYNEGDMYRLQHVLEQEKIENMLEKL